VILAAGMRDPVMEVVGCMMLEHRITRRLAAIPFVDKALFRGHRRTTEYDQGSHYGYRRHQLAENLLCCTLYGVTRQVRQAARSVDRMPSRNSFVLCLSAR
jgi:hypothetical protein